MLDQPFEKGHYEEMKRITGMSNKVDVWFAGCIRSLFYKPNEYSLIFEEKRNSGFFRSISLQGWYGDKIYTSMVYQIEFDRASRIFPTKHDFKVRNGHGDKRLSSYCSTVNEWRFPQSNKFILHKSNGADLNSISILDMWRELFNTFS